MMQKPCYGVMLYVLGKILFECSWSIFIHLIQEMCHVHTTDNMLQNKITAIVDCYFQSSAPPKLQLNIPLNVAEEVTSKPRGPYVFRVAQVFTCT